MERVQEDGVRLTEEELEERRQELLAKAEIQVSQNLVSASHFLNKTSFLKEMI